MKLEELLFPISLSADALARRRSKKQDCLRKVSKYCLGWREVKLRDLKQFC